MFKGRFFVCADIHGDANIIRYIIDCIDNPTEEDTIIICGDAGFEYQDYVMGAAKRAARKFPGTWVVVRGNHDSSYWSEHTIKDSDTAIGQWSILRGENGDDFLYQKKYPNILYTRDDGGIYHIGKFTFLMLPGAYSIDKDYRIRRGYPYNPNEQLSNKQMNELMDITNYWVNSGYTIDYVIGHTFPRYLEPQYSTLFMHGINQNLVDRRTENWLDSMSDIFEKAHGFKQYFGGHFHGYKKLTDKYTMVYHKIVELED